MAVRNPNGADYGRAPTIDTGRGSLDILDPDINAMFLYSRRARDVAFKDINFLDTAFNTDPWTVSAGGTATTWAQDPTIPGGAIKGVTGTTAATSGLSLFGAPVLQPQYNAGFEARMMASAVTGLRMEIGLIDALTTKTSPAVSDVDGTPTFNAGLTEGALMAWNTGDTITTPRFVSKSAVYTTARGETIMQPYSLPAADQTAWVPTAGEWFTVRVQCFGPPPGSELADATGSVVCMVFDDSNNLVSMVMFDAIEGGLVGGVAPTAMLAPWIFAKAENATSKDIHVAYARYWADRYLS